MHMRVVWGVLKCVYVYGMFECVCVLKCVYVYGVAFVWQIDSSYGPCMYICIVTHPQVLCDVVEPPLPHRLALGCSICVVLL